MIGLLRLAALSTVALFGLSAAAYAAMGPAVTNSSANLRQGPGTSFPIIDSVGEGETVSVNACTLSWCAVDTNDGEHGFIAKSLLDFGSDNTDNTDQGNFNLNGDNGTPVTPGVTDVCVYLEPNFMGANFCINPGEKEPIIEGNFNDAIESILVEGDIAIKVCMDPHYHQCTVITHSMKKLPLSLRDNISSYAVLGAPIDNGDDNTTDDNSDDNSDQGDFNLTN